MSARSPSRIALITLAMIIATLVLAEGFAHLVLAWLPSPPPIALDWGTEATNTRKRELRDTVYIPDRECFFRLAPDLDLKDTASPRIFDLDSNSLGLRGPEVSAAKAAGVQRILCIGDSCTFGSGAAGNKTYPAQLQKLLDSDSVADSFEVINAGVPGYSSFQALAYLESRGLALGPDFVVLIAGYNDTSDATVGRKGPHGTGHPLSDLDYSRLGREAKESPFALGRLAARAGFSQVDEADPDTESGTGAPTADDAREASAPFPRVSLEDYRANIERFSQLASTHGFKGIVCAWPLRVQSAPRFGDEDEKLGILPAYQQALLETGAAVGLDTLDLRTALKGKGSHFADRVHMNGMGYALVARVLRKALGL